MTDGRLRVPADRAAEAVLVAHQAHRNASCLCGWSELGKSHPGHQVAKLREVGLLADEAAHQQPDDRMLAAYGAALLRDVADLIDRGPAIPLPPSIISALVRERADDLAGSA